MKQVRFSALTTILAILALSVLSAYQPDEKVWTLSGLKKEYHQNDSISFSLKKRIDTCECFVMTGAETRLNGKWCLFVEDISDTSRQYRKFVGGLVFNNNNNYNNTATVTWHPSWHRQFTKAEFRHFFRGPFRFKFRAICDNSKERYYFFSDTFTVD